MPLAREQIVIVGISENICGNDDQGGTPMWKGTRRNGTGGASFRSIETSWLVFLAYYSRVPLTAARVSTAQSKSSGNW